MSLLVLALNVGSCDIAIGPESEAKWKYLLHAGNATFDLSGLPLPFRGEQFCSVTVLDGAYVVLLASVRAAQKTATYRILRLPQLAA
jgi:hypothetical protein